MINKTLFKSMSKYSILLLFIMFVQSSKFIPDFLLGIIELVERANLFLLYLILIFISSSTKRALVMIPRQQFLLTYLARALLSGVILITYTIIYSLVFNTDLNILSYIITILYSISFILFFTITFKTMYDTGSILFPIIFLLLCLYTLAYMILPYIITDLPLLESLLNLYPFSSSFYTDTYQGNINTMLILKSIITLVLSISVLKTYKRVEF